MTMTLDAPRISAVVNGAGRTPACAGAPLLSVTGLCVNYGSERAVTDASLLLHRGEVLGLAGGPGSGKSTLACAVTGLLRPPGVITRGRVLWHPEPVATAVPWLRPPRPDGCIAVDVLTRSADDRGGWHRDPLAVVLTEPAPACGPALTIQARLSGVLRRHRPWWTGVERLARAGQLLEQTGIPVGWMSSFPHELAASMRRRFEIALALACDPQILILDEPPTAPGSGDQQGMLGELLDLRENLDLAIIIASRDRPRVAGAADIVAVMDAGRITETASRADRTWPADSRRL